MEKSHGGFVPDVVLYADGVPLIIEVFVTHNVDSQKLGKIRELGVSALQIDLSRECRDLDRMKSLLIGEGHHKKWLFSRLSGITEKRLEAAQKAKDKSARDSLGVRKPPRDLEIVTWQEAQMVWSKLVELGKVPPCKQENSETDDPGSGEVPRLRYTDLHLVTFWIRTIDPSMSKMYLDVCLFGKGLIPRRLRRSQIPNYVIQIPR